MPWCCCRRRKVQITKKQSKAGSRPSKLSSKETIESADQSGDRSKVRGTPGAALSNRSEKREGVFLVPSLTYEKCTPHHQDHLLEKTQSSMQNSVKDVRGVNDPCAQTPQKRTRDLGGVNIANTDITMRCLMKNTREVTMAPLTRKEWTTAVDEIYEQFEKDQSAGYDSAKAKKKIEGHVQMDLDKSVVYVVPTEFTQESETTQSSQMPTSASVVP
ncbi:hypothetical protein DdX_00322 [Ditylenchus destructor]|uniref:Uncharacterized protein n=1 Tax=Ditylenchus destructor TaxID=166010 RepID=A0AAD4RA92_9BILA|nr:hypothetical protein DdX_00322 [Ditylenchus destructor]